MRSGEKSRLIGNVFLLSVGRKEKRKLIRNQIKNLKKKFLFRLFNVDETRNERTARSFLLHGSNRLSTIASFLFRSKKLFSKISSRRESRFVENYRKRTNSNVHEFDLAKCSARIGIFCQRSSTRSKSNDFSIPQRTVGRTNRQNHRNFVAQHRRSVDLKTFMENFNWVLFVLKFRICGNSAYILGSLVEIEIGLKLFLSVFSNYKTKSSVNIVPILTQLLTHPDSECTLNAAGTLGTIVCTFQINTKKSIDNSSFFSFISFPNFSVAQKKAGNFYSNIRRSDNLS